MSPPPPRARGLDAEERGRSDERSDASPLLLDAPPSASARRYLRGNLPAVYHESPDGGPPPVMGLLEGLEQVLDPVVTLLDNLSRHLQAATAPADMIDLLTELTGAPVDDTLPIQARRGLAMAASRIAQGRGTRAGLQIALESALPELGPQVRDNGQTTWGLDSKTAPTATAVSLEIRVTQAPSPEQRAQLVRCVADHLPVGVVYSIGLEDRDEEGH